jgi:hypothetical protein
MLRANRRLQGTVVKAARSGEKNSREFRKWLC